MASNHDVVEIEAHCPEVEHLASLFQGCGAAGVIISALDLKIFDKIAMFPDGVTASVLAKMSFWDEENTERLLNSLTSLQLLNKALNTDDHEVYSNTGSGRHLMSTNKENLSGLFHWAKRFFHVLSNLTEQVKTGSKKESSFPAQVTFHKKLEHEGSDSKGEESDDSHHHHHHHHHGHGHHHGAHTDEERMRTMFQSRTAKMQPYIKQLVTAFDLKEYRTAVDLGGGSGVVSYELSRCYPDMHITVFDVPPVIKFVKEHCYPKDEELNCTFYEGDFMDDGELPKADFYLLSKIIHDWNEGQITQLLGKIYWALNPGGAIMLFEHCLNDDKTGPAAALQFDLFVMACCAGRFRSFQEYKDLLEKNGFKDVKFGRTSDLCEWDVIYAKKA